LAPQKLSLDDLADLLPLYFPATKAYSSVDDGKVLATQAIILWSKRIEEMRRSERKIKERKARKELAKIRVSKLKIEIEDLNSRQ
jgi:hypothetical protein